MSVCSMSASITTRVDHSAHRSSSGSKLQLIESEASHLPVNMTPETEDVSPNQRTLTAQPRFLKAWDSL